jgi:multidrug efflux pump subunit AcrA (membrane-fusion protein)
MFASVSLPLERARTGVFIPAGTLVENQTGRSQVFVLENGKARRREVVFGQEQDGQVEVISGLERGEVVVVKGPDRLHDGSRVLAVQ